jgi:GMP synthase-like glutamine amidotransferase
MAANNSKRFQALILQNAKGEDHGYFAEILDHKGWEQRLIKLHRGEGIPINWPDYEVIMIMGGPMNVYEEEIFPYLADENKLIKEALKRNVPLLGFCLGAQLIAKASGAKVVKGHKKEIGWFKVQLTEEGIRDPILRSFPKSFQVFQWHGDTFELPKNAVRLSGSRDYSNQAIRIGQFSYGFQFHFEITGDMISEWLEDGKEEIDSLGDPSLRETIIKETENNLADMRTLGELFFMKYLTRVQKSY